ncbi:hypothetical protein L7F22_050670 [Adiantum nelumboides]|nr:hypothetical protein [Adiantum nelumboides]
MKATAVVKVAMSKIRNRSNGQVCMISGAKMLRAFVLVELCMSVLVIGDTNSLSHHSDPQEVFDKLPTREASSWNALITGYCKLGHYEGALERLEQMKCEDQKDKLWPMISMLGIGLKGDEKDLRGKVLMKQVMQTWLPASDALLEMMVFHLPSPAKAQRLRVENQYVGLLDQYANAIKNCDPEGPLMLYVSKSIPAFDKGQFFAFEQVFSGKVSTGSKLSLIVEGLKRLANLDLTVVCTIEKSGEHIILGASELHLEICLKDLHEDFLGEPEIVVSNPVVSFKEIVLEKSNYTVMSKSPNKHNCLYYEARPIEELAEAMDEGRIGPRDDPKWATKEGALAKENMRSIAFEDQEPSKASGQDKNEKLEGYGNPLRLKNWKGLVTREPRIMKGYYVKLQDHEPRKALGQEKKVSSKATGESSKSSKFLPKLLDKWNRNKEWDHEQREESQEGSLYIQEDVDFAKAFNFYDEKPLSTIGVGHALQANGYLDKDYISLLRKLGSAGDINKSTSFATFKLFKI